MQLVDTRSIISAQDLSIGPMTSSMFSQRAAALICICRKFSNAPKWCITPVGRRSNRGRLPLAKDFDQSISKLSRRRHCCQQGHKASHCRDRLRRWTEAESSGSAGTRPSPGPPTQPSQQGKGLHRPAPRAPRFHQGLRSQSQQRLCAAHSSQGRLP